MNPRFDTGGPLWPEKLEIPAQSRQRLSGGDRSHRNAKRKGAVPLDWDAGATASRQAPVYLGLRERRLIRLGVWEIVLARKSLILPTRRCGRPFRWRQNRVGRRPRLRQRPFRIVSKFEIRGDFAAACVRPLPHNTLSSKQGAAMAKGIRRITDGWGDQDSVLVKYPDGAEMEIPASQYVAQRHHPPIDALPVRSSPRRPSPKARNPDAPRS